MKISNFKYILTDLGGGWGTVHKFYRVTPDGDVYTTEKFNDTIFQLSTEIDCELLGHLDDIDLGLKDDSEIHYGVMDASDLTVYEVGKTYKKTCNGINRPTYVEDMENMIYECIHKRFFDFKSCRVIVDKLHVPFIMCHMIIIIINCICNIYCVFIYQI